MTCRAHYIISCLLDEMDDEERFNDWERGFIESIAKQIEGKTEATLTENQQNKLEDIWRK